MIARDYVGQHPYYYYFFRKYTPKYLDLNRIYVTYSEKNMYAYMYSYIYLERVGKNYEADMVKCEH